MNAKRATEESTEKPADERRELVYDRVKPGPRHTITPATPGVLKIGLIGWEQENGDDTPTLKFRTLQRSLREAFQSSRPDIVLCSGAGVSLPRRSMLRQKASQGTVQKLGKRIFNAAKCPVLFECKGHSGMWLMALDESLTLFRHQQHVFRKGREAHTGFLTIAEWNAGLGMVGVAHAGRTVTLVQATCNEVRIFDRRNASNASLLAAALRAQPMPAAFHGDWILLHPAHHSYLRKPRLGYAISHGTSQRTNALLADLTAQKSFGDDTRPPLAALHANNYYGKGAKLGEDRRGALMLYERGAPAANLARKHGNVHGQGAAWTTVTITLPSGGP